MITTGQVVTPRALPDPYPPAAPPTVRTRDVLLGIDPLTRDEIDLSWFWTGAFQSGKGVTFPTFAIVPGGRFRCTRVMVQITQNAAISGGAAETNLQLLDEGRPSGIEVGVSIPVVSSNALGVVLIPFDLGRGYVFYDGQPSVSVDVTLTSGHFRVLIAGYIEAPALGN